jgi:HD-like signal output (HDOD) protein
MTSTNTQPDTSIQPDAPNESNTNVADSSESSNPLLLQLRKDIVSKNYTLPPLPENAHRIRRLINDPQTSTHKITKLLSSDPVLTGRLIQAANSPLFRGLTTIQDIQSAVNRLGMTCIQNMVISLSVASIYVGNKDWVRTRMREIWNIGIKVAAVSEVLSRRYRHLEGSEALLAGLLHDIGSVPLLQMCAKRFGKPDAPQMLDNAIRTLSPQLSEWILKNWLLADMIYNVPKGIVDIYQPRPGEIDYSDLVLVAKLHAIRGSSHPLANIKWSELPVFTKLGLTPEESVSVIRDARQEIQEVMRMLQG